MPKNSAPDELTESQASRAQFLKVAGGTGAAGALAIFVAACGGSDKKSSGSSSSSSDKKKKPAAGDTKADIAIVNYALTLEHLEAAFYKQAIESGEVKTPAVVEAAKVIYEDEQEHVAALMATVKQLGGTPAAAPKTKFDAVIKGGEKMILTTAASVENLGASAYLGQAGKIKNKDILAAALSIHTVEARHAAVLNTVIGKSIVPDGAFAKPADMATVLKTVKPFIAA